MSFPVSRALRASLFLALALPLVAPSAAADELQFSGSLPQRKTPWADAIDIPRFDPALGDLQAVCVELATALSNVTGLENTAAAQELIEVRVKAVVRAQLPGAAPFDLFVRPDHKVSAILPAFDGTVDFGGSSGGSFVTEEEDSKSAVRPAHAAWIGAGTVSIPVDSSHTLVTLAGSSVVSGARVKPDAVLTVTYIYSPFPPSPAPAPVHDTPGSVLLFPEFTTLPGTDTIVSVTNTNTNPLSGNVNVEFRYMSSDCIEFNRIEQLTPGDNFTALSSVFNPQQQEGYLYVFVRDTVTGNPISWNHMVGEARVLDGLGNFDRSYAATAYQALAPEGGPTDANLNGRIDLDGVEYTQASEETIVPLFIGQDASVQSNLVLIDLSGGLGYTATTNFLVWNDNEEVFSAQFAFDCWERVPLTSISGVFQEAFLDLTSNDLAEIVGATNREAGWYRFTGLRTDSVSDTIFDPAIVGYHYATAAATRSISPPYQVGTRVGKLGF